MQCFGLLGVNGAGKTTTFRMLTGDTGSSLGDALIDSRSVQERGVVQRSVGYCPQVDALTDQLSGRQHLTLYAHLRGIPRSKVSVSVAAVSGACGCTADWLWCGCRSPRWWSGPCTSWT